ncbi:MAG TPA: FecR family protein [Terriglobales bacterium]|nr:FecR family protein [Terriglobales bacterium]
MVKSLLSVLLSFLLAAMPVFAAPTDGQTAGEVKTLIPAAWRNSQPLKVKDSLEWNDLLQTSAEGRLRAGLTDGSVISLGSNGALKVVQHDAVSQQTSIEMNYGKLRSQVVKITQPDGKYEVRTPNAVIGVIGTDFYVGYENDLTTVVCYVGKVSVTAVGTAKVVRKSEQVSSDQALVTLSAGQLVVIGMKAPAEGFPPESEVIRASMQDTNVNPHVFIAHPRVWIPIMAGVAGGIAAGIVVTRGGESSAAIPPPVVCDAMPRVRSQPQCQK